MGNKHSNRPRSAPQMKSNTGASPNVSRNGSQRSAIGGQPALAQAAVAAAAAAVTVTASAAASGHTNDMASSSTSSAASQMPSHLQDMLDTIQPIQLSVYQKNLLREAWHKINKKGSGSIGTLIFRRMFSKNPEIKQVFQHLTVIEGVFGFGLTPMQVTQNHSIHFVQILDMAIEQLDDLRPFTQKCVEYGAKHAPYRNYGFKADMWDIFGECMTEAAREWEGWKKHRETIRAWTILVSFIVDRMRQGYETAVRRNNFMKQLSIKQSSIGGDANEDSLDSDAPTGSGLCLQTERKRGSATRLEERRQTAVGSKLDLTQDDHQYLGGGEATFVRLSRAESQ